MTEIRPSDIDPNNIVDAFGNTETEVSAAWLVRFCQTREGDDWRPFSHDDLLGFYQEGRLRSINRKRAEKNLLALTQCDETFRYNRLTTRLYYPWVTKKDGQVYLTVEFIQRCFAASPAPTTVFPGASP